MKNNKPVRSPARWRPTVLQVCVIVALGLLSLGSTPLVHAQAAGPTYFVQSGDTLYSIARAFGVTVAALQTANNIADPSLLSVGQTLVIPGYEGIAGKLATYQIQLGDSLVGLAKRFGATQADLIKINHLTNAQDLYVSQPLIYAEGGQGLATGRTLVTGKSESLYSMAAANNLSPWALALVNDLSSPAAVYTGQNVIVPGDAPANPPLSGLPEPFEALSLNPLRPTQGSTMEISAQVSQGVTLEGQFANWILRFAPIPDAATTSSGSTANAAIHLVALQGIDAFFVDPGLYTLTLKATQPDGTLSTFEQLVPVASGGYPTQSLAIGADMAGLLDPNVTKPEDQAVLQVVSTYTPDKLWNGVFLMPVQSPTIHITTGFGWPRSYNGGPFSSYHDGIDWGGVPGGTPITAPADGKVVFTQASLPVRGNATIIDHGWGVFSGYWHQSKIEVKVGDQVKGGQEIGQVGNTGFSTGAHLHFEIWVGGVATDPRQWLSTVYP